MLMLSHLRLDGYVRLAPAATALPPWHEGFSQLLNSADGVFRPPSLLVACRMVVPMVNRTQRHRKRIARLES